MLGDFEQTSFSKVQPIVQCFAEPEGVVNVYDAATLLGAGRLEESDLHSLRRSLFESLANDPGSFGLDKRLRDFLTSLWTRRPIEARGQKCGMDQ